MKTEYPETECQTSVISYPVNILNLQASTGAAMAAEAVEKE